MTTFTSDDREEAYKKIVEAAPNQPGYEDAVPIPYNGLAFKELTDEEIIAIVNETLESWNTREAMLKFARAILQKAKEK